MLDYNHVVVTGRLGRDPETSEAGESTVTRFSVAVNDRWKEGETTQEHVNWIPVAVWNKNGENAAKYLKKGSRVLIEGTLRVSQWETDNGEKKYRTEVVARKVIFLDKKGE